MNTTQQLEMELYKTLPINELKQRAKDAHELATTLDRMVETYIENQLKSTYGADFCKLKCRYSAVFSLSSDWSHNLCGNKKAPCTCCSCPCQYYEPDNAITAWIKSNVAHREISQTEYEGLKSLRLDIFNDSLSEKDKELIKQVLYHKI